MCPVRHDIVKSEVSSCQLFPETSYVIFLKILAATFSVRVWQFGCSDALSAATTIFAVRTICQSWNGKNKSNQGLFWVVFKHYTILQQFLAILENHETGCLKTRSNVSSKPPKRYVENGIYHNIPTQKVTGSGSGDKVNKICLRKCLKKFGAFIRPVRIYLLSCLTIRVTVTMTTSPLSCRAVRLK